MGVGAGWESEWGGGAGCWAQEPGAGSWGRSLELGGEAGAARAAAAGAAAAAAAAAAAPAGQPKSSKHCKISQIIKKTVQSN